MLAWQLLRLLGGEGMCAAGDALQLDAASKAGVIRGWMGARGALKHVLSIAEPHCALCRGGAGAWYVYLRRGSLVKGAQSAGVREERGERAKKPPHSLPGASY